MNRPPASVPANISDPINAAILAVSEDRLAGFQVDPFGEIAERSGVPLATVIERVGAMLRAGTIRRVRQTLLATSLAGGALCAWQVAPDRLDAAFDYLWFATIRFRGSRHSHDRRGDGGEHVSALDDPQGAAGILAAQSTPSCCADKIGAERFRLMPAKGSSRWASVTCGAEGSNPERVPRRRPSRPRRRSSSSPNSSGAC